MQEVHRSTDEMPSATSQRVIHNLHPELKKLKLELLFLDDMRVKM